MIQVFYGIASYKLLQLHSMNVYNKYLCTQYCVWFVTSFVAFNDSSRSLF